MYRSSRFARVARDSVMSDDSMQSTLGNLDVLVQGDDEDWLYSPSKPSAKDATSREGDDDLSLLLSANRPRSLLAQDGEDETGLLVPGNSNSLGLHLGGCPSPTPSSVWSISRPGSRMRGTPDLGDLGRAVKNDGQMDDTDDLVTSPTIEFKGYDLENEAQWKNATDLNSPTKANFHTNGPSALAQHLLRKNKSVTDPKGTSGRNSPTRRLQQQHKNGLPRINLTSRFHAVARETSEGDIPAAASSPLARSHPIISDTEQSEDTEDNTGTTITDKDDANVRPLPLRTATSGSLSAKPEGTFSPASSSSSSSLIDPEEMNWQLDETVSITSQSSFHSMEGLATSGPKTSSSSTANANSHGGFSLNHSSSSLSSLSVNSESSGLVTDAWLNSARKASAPPLPTLEDHKKIGTGPKPLRSPRLADTASRQLQRAGTATAKLGTDGRPALNRRASSPAKQDASDDEASSAPAPITQLFAASRAAPSVPNSNGSNAGGNSHPTSGLPQRRGHAPSKSGSIGSIRPPQPSTNSSASTGTSTPVGKTLRTRKSMAELPRSGTSASTTNGDPSSPQRPPQRSSRLALPAGTSLSRSRSTSPVRQPPSPVTTTPARRTMPAGGLAGPNTHGAGTARRSLAAPRSPMMGESKLASPSMASLRRPAASTNNTESPVNTTRRRESNLPSPSSPISPTKSISSPPSKENNRSSQESLDWIPGGIPGSTNNNTSKRTMGFKKLLNPLRLGKRSDSDDSDDDGAVTGFFKQNVAAPKPTKSGSLLSRVASVGKVRPPSLSLSKRTSVEVRSPPATHVDNPMDSMGNINPLASKSRSVVSFLGKSNLARRSTNMTDGAPACPTAMATRHVRQPSTGNTSTIPRSVARPRAGTSDAPGTNAATAALRRLSAEYTGEPAATRRLSTHSRRASGASFSSSTMSGQSSQRNSLVMSREPSVGSNAPSRIRRISQEGAGGLRSPGLSGPRTLRRSTTSVSRQPSTGSNTPQGSALPHLHCHQHRLSNELSGMPLSPQSGTGLRSPGGIYSNGHANTAPSRIGGNRSIRNPASSGIRRIPSSVMPTSPNSPSGQMEFI
ncbi:hypothetical protein BDF19DRAFT_424515 [Syncephalis fuscata]|nr:hypothetical protein BDF19DRAFT_424515 [Syncephalis fuscata]